MKTMGIITLTILILCLINLTGGSGDIVVGNLIGLGVVWLVCAFYWMFKGDRKDND